MTDSPQFILIIAVIHWALCARIYVVCIVPIDKETVETIQPTQPIETAQPETVETKQAAPFATLVDGVVDWGEVNYKR